MGPLRSCSTIKALTGFGIVAGLFHYSLCLVRLQGRSMEPNFHPGQWLLVRRLNWPAVPPRDGDVVVLQHRGEILVKRVAALPGERPSLDDLGLPLSLRPERIARDPWLARAVAELTAPVPEGHLYVLGDNPEVSEDSRDFGPIPGSAVIGRVVEWNAPDPPDRMWIRNAVREGARVLALRILRYGKGAVP